MPEKKKFFEIELPILKQKINLLATSEANLVGRTIKLDLTRRLRGKSVEAIFKILQEQGKVKAVPYRLHILGYFIRRMMRKSVNYVEDSFSSECENAVLRIKPFLITRKKVARKVRKALRNKAKEEIEKDIRNQKTEDIFSEIIAGKFTRNLSLKLKKVYPLAFCDIRDIYVETSKLLKDKSNFDSAQKFEVVKISDKEKPQVIILEEKIK